MHLVMFMKDKQPRAGVIDGDDIVDINANDRSLPPTLKGILEANGLSRVKKVMQVEEDTACRRSGAKLLPPISNPGLLLSVGMNYHEHLKEMKTPGAREAGRVHQERREHHRLRPADPAAGRATRTWSTGKASSPW